MNEQTEAIIIYFLFTLSLLLGWPLIMAPIIGDFWMAAGFPFYGVSCIMLIIFYYDDKSKMQSSRQEATEQ